jgi:MFS family permease
LHVCFQNHSSAWFEENQALAYFGVSYSVMAVAGTFSFFTGFLSDRIGPTRSIWLGIVVYAAGLFLRIYTHSVWIVAASGFIAGLGASLVIICMRHWVVSVSKADGEKASLVSIQQTGTHFGAALGMVSVGFIPAWLGAPSFSYPVVLAGVAVFCLFCVFFGLSQSAFFVGDALGGSVGGWLYSYHMNFAILVCGVLTLLNAMLVPLLFAIVKAKEKNRMAHDRSFHKNL